MELNITIMNKYKYYLLAAFALCLFSCSSGTDVNEGYIPADKQPNTGAPVITAVYKATDTQRATPITEAMPGDNIVIVGSNLNNLKKLSFNNVEADLSKTYTASNVANVSVPTAFEQTRNNQIEYTTDMGTATFAFVVTFPEMTVSHLVNEFAAGGTVLDIVGENFDYYGFGLSESASKVYYDKKELKVDYVSAEGLGVTLPATVADNSKVTIEWVDFRGTTQKAELALRPTAGILFADMSKAQRDKTDQCVTIEDDSKVTSTKSALGTKHLHFSGTISSYAWVELSFSQNLPDVGGVAKLGDYNFVFEVLTAEANPLLGKGHEFAWNWDWMNSYLWNPGNGNGLNTNGKWQTIRISLDELAPNGLGEVGEWSTLNIGFQPSEAYEADFRMGNFRIQKK